MNFRWIVIIFLVVLLLLWLKLRKKRTVLPGRKAESYNAKQVSVPLEKGVNSCCLLLDGRLFGKNFAEKEPPEIPCCENCRCRVEDTFFKSSDVFDLPKNTEVTYESDLGTLDFKTYKYYKYSLILYNNNLSEEETKNYVEIRDLIKVSKEFKQKVIAHLGFDDPELIKKN